jgi:hypothetical protein
LCQAGISPRHGLELRSANATLDLKTESPALVLTANISLPIITAAIVFVGSGKNLREH